MRLCVRSAPKWRCFVLPILALSFAAGLEAQVPFKRNGTIARLAFTDPRLRPVSRAEPLEPVSSLLDPGLKSGWAGFAGASGGSWQAYVDRRTGRLTVAEGAGLPWIPGAGNTLKSSDVSTLGPSGKVDLAALERSARAFLPRVAPLLGVDPADLVLSAGRSGSPSDSLWLIDFDVRRGARTIEGARVAFRISNGNLIQFGSEGVPAAGTPTPKLLINRRQAKEALASFVGGFRTGDSILDPGSLHLLPVEDSDPRQPEGFEPGRGRGLVLVWEITFRRPGETGTWRGRIDATSGRVLELQDVNRYAKVQGGVYAESPVDGPERVLPMPFTFLRPSGGANSAGVYEYLGTAVESRLDGARVAIQDSCGPISLASAGDGTISFGTSGGSDCSTPGIGGAGNTHASRSQFYHLNRIKEVGRGWLPENSWLSNSTLTSRVNLPDTCKAFWDGTAVNFSRSGGGCGNLGEIAGLAMHEFGHALDQNDGNSFSDPGTGESYGDVTSLLARRQSCLGNGFYGVRCDGYGDACTSCTGVRDVDWGKHASNTPHTVQNYTRTFCPADTGYDGPCGREAHCESHVISEAVWDLAARDLPNPGSASAWATVERLWYRTRSTTGSAFTCHTDTAPWTSDGCALGSLWRAFRAADDDDGNLANGTPHSCQIFAAFNRHGLACSSDPGANVCQAACTPPAAPSLTATPGATQVDLSWSNAGAGMVYDVERSDLGCASGFVRIASGLPTTSFSDPGVADGLPYSYQVTARPGGNEACAGAPSVCRTATPTGPGCTAPGAPAGVAVEALGADAARITWNAVTGAGHYRIFRAPSPGGTFAQIGSVAAPATSFIDTAVSEGASYSYKVQAAADVCVSPDSGTVTVKIGTCNPLTLYANDFESGSGLSDWTLRSISGAVTHDWRGILACGARSGSRVFRFGGPTCAQPFQPGQAVAALPQGAIGIAVPASASRVRLSFWHRWSFGGSGNGGGLNLAVDGGAPKPIPPEALVSGAGYREFGLFTGLQSTFVQTVVDLDSVCAGGCAGHTLRIEFAARILNGPTDLGWFLDDVTVTACAARGCTGAPAIGTASTPSNNQVQVTWSNGAPPSSTFNVYRALGTCAAPGAFAPIGTGLAGSPFLDTAASGGTTYAYRVSGVTANGSCESDPSACVQAAPTGPCTLPPLFGGLATATDPALATCGLQLAWSAGSSRCGGSVTYELYRDTVPGFTPGAGNRIASGLTGTSLADPGPLTSGTTYFYVVRARDSANGLDDGNLQRRSAYPSGPLVRVETRTDTFEGAGSGGGFDLQGWTHSSLSGDRDWAWSGAESQSPEHSWFAPQEGSAADQVLVTPPFKPQAGGSSLRFWHRYSLETDFDGGTLEVSTNQGASWSVVPDAAFGSGGFTTTLPANGGNPIGGKRAWTGTIQNWSEVQVDLASWVGSEVRFRWHGGEDPSTGFLGWFVDSVTIANAAFAGVCRSEPPAPLSFYTVTPCRLIDTRNPNGPLGGPALQPGGTRAFALAGSCGVPASARSLSVNVTVTGPQAAGFLTLYPGDQVRPSTSTVNFTAGQTRANNAILSLGEGTGVLEVYASGGPVHLIVDVNGYFQ